MKDNNDIANTKDSELINIEHKKYDVEISLGSPKGGVMIADKFYPNILVRNYWRWLTGMLNDATAPMTDIADIDRAVATNEVLIAAGWAATLEFGTSVTAAAYTQNKLFASDDSTEGSLSAWAKTVLTDEIVLSISRTAATGNAREMCIQQRMYPDAFYMLSRVVPGTPPTTGQLVTYKMRIPRPWVGLYADWMLGVLTGTQVSSKDTSSSIFTMKMYVTAMVAGPVRLYIGTGTGAHAWTDFALTAPQRMTETYTRILNATDTTLVVSGFIKPTSAVTVGEVGVIGYIFDTAGVGREVLLARKVLPTPITVAANAIFTVKMDVTA